MNFSNNRLRNYIKKHIWAHFAFNFIVFFTIQYLLDRVFEKDFEALTELLLETAIWTFVMTPIFIYLNKIENGHDPYAMVDHVRHYKTGQRPQLKKYLETKGYKVDLNEGSISYFSSDKDNPISRKQTFIHETDHWIALVAKPEILEDVPSTIVSIYLQRK